MSRNDEGVHVGWARAIRFSQKAMLVWLKEQKRDVWVPHSQVHDDSEVYDKENTEGELVVSAWFAEKEGLA